MELENYDMTVIDEEMLLEQLDLAAITPEETKIETNRAYNEAEKFISEVENSKSEPTETTEGKLQEMNDAISDSKSTGQGLEHSKKSPEKEKKTLASNSNAKKDKVAVVSGGNRNTTISYQLVDRKDLDLPNPVYVCEGSGKVVISIEVSETGRVVKSSYNKRSSTTSNECLIDSALEYASQALFTTKAGKTRQLGTITFNFPGQF